MARNWEKQLGRLNRLVLSKQNQDLLEKNPKRPNLGILNTSEDVSRWIPSIKEDLQYYLSQMKVGCYPERKINEFNDKIDSLKKEYHAFIHKLKRLDSSFKVIPWTERSYNKDLQSKNQSKSKNAIDLKNRTADEKNKDNTSYSSPVNNTLFERLKLPILESEIEQDYKSEQLQPLVNYPKSSENCKNEIESFQTSNPNEKHLVELLHHPKDRSEHLLDEDNNVHVDSQLISENRSVSLTEQNLTLNNCDKSVPAQFYNDEPLIFNYSVGSELDNKKAACTDEVNSKSLNIKQCDGQVLTSVVNYSSSSDSESS